MKLFFTELEIEYYLWYIIAFVIFCSIWYNKKYYLPFSSYWLKSGVSRNFVSFAVFEVPIIEIIRVITLYNYMPSGNIYIFFWCVWIFQNFYCFSYTNIVHFLAIDTFLGNLQIIALFLLTCIYIFFLLSNTTWIFISTPLIKIPFFHACVLYSITMPMLHITHNSIDNMFCF